MWRIVKLSVQEEEVKHSQCFVQKLLFFLKFLLQTLHLHLQLNVLEKRFNKTMRRLMIEAGESRLNDF